MSIKKGVLCGYLEHEYADADANCHTPKKRHHLSRFFLGHTQPRGIQRTRNIVETSGRCNNFRLTSR